MNTSPISLTYKKIQPPQEEEQQVLDDIFDVLFSSIVENSSNNQFEVITGLTITGV